MINISEDDVKVFKQNGFTKEQIGATVNHYRKMGLSDDEIQTKINNKINSFDVEGKTENKKFNPLKATPEELNTKIKEIGQERLNKRKEWEENHPIISRIQADYQPGYRLDRLEMERQAEYGINQPVKEALKDIPTKTGLALVPYLNAVRDALLSRVGGGSGVWSKLGREALIGGVQGGTAEALDELSNNGLSTDVLKRGVVGTAGGSLIGGTLSGGSQGLKAGGEFIKKGIDNPTFQTGLVKVMEGLTSVPQKFSERALQKELAGKSILNGKFDAETAYRPIEAQLRKAKGMLPTPESYADEFFKLGEKAKNGMENIKQAAGQEISEMLGKMGNRPMDISGLRSSINSLVDSYARGGNLNPAEIRAGRDLELVRDMLGIKNSEQVKNELANYYKGRNNTLVNGGNAPLNREAQEIAFDVLSQATGKDKRWLKSQLNANMPQMSTQKRQEFIQELLDSTADKIDNIDPSWQTYFPELNWENLQETEHGGEMVARKMFERIMGKDFVNPMENLKDPMTEAVEDAAKKYNKLLYDMTQNPTKGGMKKALSDIDNVTRNLDDSGKEVFSEELVNDMDNIENITNERVKPIDLHNAKEILYDMANYDTAGGTRNEVLKSVANQINNFLRSKNPAYKAPNDRFAMIKNIENELGGINSSTIGSKLMKYGSEGNKLSGLDQKLKNIDMILNPQDRFLQRTKDLVKSQAEVNNINKLINQSYERNPRLLSNINDTAREEALESLQEKSGINFMDKLNDIRAREALEAMTPGQGGGYGSSQGSFNKLRGGIITALAGSGGVMGGLPGAIGAPLLGMSIISPKIMAKGTIKNLGEVYKRLGREIPDSVRRLLTPLLIDSIDGRY